MTYEKVREVVYTSEGWASDNLVELIAWLSEQLGKVPEQYRGKAECDISAAYGYGDSIGVDITISYCRPMTEAEIAAEAARDLRTAAKYRERDLRMLADLKRKYESFDTEAEAIEAARKREP